MDYVLHFVRNQNLLFVLLFLARPSWVHTVRKLEPADVAVEYAGRVEVQMFYVFLTCI